MYNNRKKRTLQDLMQMRQPMQKQPFGGAATQSPMAPPVMQNQFGMNKQPQSQGTPLAQLGMQQGMQQAAPQMKQRNPQIEQLRQMAAQDPRTRKLMQRELLRRMMQNRRGGMR